LKRSVDLTELAQYATFNDPSLINYIKYFLNDPNVSEMKGSERLGLLCENFKLLTFEQAYRLLDPDAFRDEFEDAQSYKNRIRLLNYARIALSLLPLILTWFALFLAATSYQQDLAKHPDDKTTAFLQLWQEGFRNTTILTFSTTAIIDVVLLLGFLATTIYILFLEYHVRNESTLFAARLRTITDGLLRAVNAEGITPVTSQADIDKVVKAVRATLGNVFDNLETLINDSRTVILKADTTIEQLFLTRVDPMFTKFEQNISTFQQDVIKLTQELNQTVAASNAVVNASTSMAASSAKMITSSTDLSQHVSHISSHLVSIDTGQKQTVQEIQNVARNMSSATFEVKNAADKIATIRPQDVQRIATNANDFADKTKDVTTELQKVIVQLQRIAGAVSSSPMFLRRLSNIFR